MATATLTAGSPPAMPAVPDTISTRRVIAFLAMVFGMFMAILDIQIVSASLTEIQAGLAASANVGEFHRHHTQDLIASVVSVSVVNTFEVVDVHDSDGKWRFERGLHIVKRAPRRKSGEFVMVGEEIRTFNQRAGDGEPRSCEVSESVFRGLRALVTAPAPVPDSRSRVMRPACPGR